MKRLLLVLFAALLLAVLGPSPASANWWPWGHHSKSKSKSAAAASEAYDPPKKSSKPKKAKTPKSKHQKHQQASGEHLYSTPKTVGWFRKGPGPAGAGS